MNVLYCVLFGSRVGVRIRLSVWLVTGYALVFVLVSAIIVTLPERHRTPTKIEPHIVSAGAASGGGGDAGTCQARQSVKHINLQFGFRSLSEWRRRTRTQLISNCHADGSHRRHCCRQRRTMQPDFRPFQHTPPALNPLPIRPLSFNALPACSQ